MRLDCFAVGCAVFSALFVGLPVLAAFLGAYLKADLARFVGVLFVPATFAFNAAPVIVLRAIFLAVNSGAHAAGR